MKIGIDGNEANVKDKVGVSTYASRLLDEFAKNAKTSLRFVVYLRSEPLSHMPAENDFFHYRIVKGSILWSQIFLPIALFRDRQIDVFFSPAHYAPRYSPVPVVVTIHDLSFLQFPEEFLKKDLYQLTHWTAYSVRKASMIISVSKTTKKDIIHYYHIPDEHIRVVYNGFEKSIKPISPTDIKNVLDKYHLQKKSYILYVGTIQPRKNIVSMIRTFARWHDTHPEMKLVIVGKKGWLYDETLRTIQEEKIEKNIIYTEFIPDETLVALYSQAFCLTLPSLYEGFGIPLLEAMNYKCPVVTSFSSSLPEIGGEACLYFNPQDPQELQEKWDSLLQESGLRKHLIDAGQKRLTSFSWSRCASETLQTLQSLVDSRSHD